MECDTDEAGRFIVIVGFGPVGRVVADRFERLGARCRIIELNTETVRKQAERSRDIMHGDATDTEVLRAAGVEHADAVVITIPDDAAMVRACRAVREVAPDVFLAVRASYLSQGMLARAEGADQVVVEEIAAAESMANLVQEKLTGRPTAARRESGTLAEAERLLSTNENGNPGEGSGGSGGSGGGGGGDSGTGVSPPAT